MRLLRHGEFGKEKPGILDQDGKIRDLSEHITDINGENINDEGLKTPMGHKFEINNVMSIYKKGKMRDCNQVENNNSFSLSYC